MEKGTESKTTKQDLEFLLKIREKLPKLLQDVVGKDIEELTNISLESFLMFLDDLSDNLSEIYPNYTIELDNDIRNKEEVYSEIAKFIHEKLKQPFILCLTATHILCQETDKRLLKDDIHNRNLSLIESAKNLIVAIKVHYKPLKRLKYNRIIEIYFRQGNQPVVFKKEQELEWDRLSPDVRANHIRKGAETMIFDLYIKE